jgi:hypothetical protein
MMAGAGCPCGGPRWQRRREEPASAAMYVARWHQGTSQGGHRCSRGARGFGWPVRGRSRPITDDACGRHGGSFFLVPLLHEALKLARAGEGGGARGAGARHSSAVV